MAVIGSVMVAVSQAEHLLRRVRLSLLWSGVCLSFVGGLWTTINGYYSSKHAAAIAEATEQLMSGGETFPVISVDLSWRSISGDVHSGLLGIKLQSDTVDEITSEGQHRADELLTRRYKDIWADTGRPLYGVRIDISPPLLPRNFSEDNSDGWGGGMRYAYPELGAGAAGAVLLSGQITLPKADRFVIEIQANARNGNWKETIGLLLATFWRAHAANAGSRAFSHYGT